MIKPLPLQAQRPFAPDNPEMSSADLQGSFEQLRADMREIKHQQTRTLLVALVGCTAASIVTQLVVAAL